MSHPSIVFDGISKRYELGKSLHEYASLREQVSAWLSPTRRALSEKSRELWALKDVNFDIAEREVTAFFGPSGCGANSRGLRPQRSTTAEMWSLPCPLAYFSPLLRPA